MPGQSDNIILTTAGLNYLKARKQAGQKAVIQRFRIGDEYRFIPSEADTAIHGNQVYEGLAMEQMWWIQYSPDEIVVRCRVDSDKGDFLIGNLGLYTDTNELLFIRNFAYQHHKMHTTDKAPGGRWTFQLRIMTPNVLDLFDMSSIEQRYADMNERLLSDADTPSHPFDSFYTEIQLNDAFLPTNRSGYMTLSGRTSRSWYSPMFQMAESNVIVFDRYELSGGEASDRHQAIW
ncbi:putative tail fiber protein [Rhizobium phage RHph_I42]|nr:putative tail fiber protein [Rhizobium phage RHph_I42]